MKRHNTKTIAITVLAILACSVGLTQTGCKRRTSVPTEVFSDPVHQQLLNELAMTMSADQKQKVTAILVAFERNVTEWSAINGPKLMQLQAIKGTWHGGTPVNITEEESAAARNEYSRLEAERRDMDTQLLADLQAAMSEEQFAQAKEIIHPTPPPWMAGLPNRFHLVSGLGLSDQQTAQIAKIKKDAKASAADPSAGPMGDEESTDRAWQRILDEVLSQEQLGELADIVLEYRHRMRIPGAYTAELRLSAEQIAKIQAIWGRAFAEVKADPDPNAMVLIYPRAQDEINNTVLTPEQLDRMRQGGGGMGHMGGGGGMSSMGPGQ